MNPSIRTVVAGVIAAAVGLVVLIFLFGSMGYNHAHDWQVHQSVFGKLTIIDKAGYYPKMWGQVWTYPRYVEYYYTAKPDRGSTGSTGDESVRVTFNDSGTAQIGVYVKLQTPIENQERLQFHQIMRGEERNVRDAVEAHMINCVKAAGPLMSSTENQTSRKAEFNNVIEEMLGKGLYVMKRHVVTVDDGIIDQKTPEHTAEGVSGKTEVKRDPIKVQATEVVTDEKTGEAKVASESPLKRYGMAVEQFSVVETEYDPDTLKQFQAKKSAFLLAEQAKAEQQRAVQEKFKITAEGESKVEEIRQQGEQEKMKAMVSAEKEAEVAELAKKKAVTEASQKVEVAMEQKKQADTELEIAEVKVKIADAEKAAEIAMAEGKQKSLEIGGALSDEQKMLATLKAERDGKVAEALSKIQMPRFIINGGGGTGEGGTHNTMDQLITLRLMSVLGILDEGDDTFTPKQRRAATADAIFPPAAEELVKASK